jgi:hypothetical protein
MHPPYHNWLLPAVTCFIFASCAKNMSNTGTGPGTKPVTPVTPVTPDSTVYIAGYNGANAILWKNGIPDTLSPTLGIANQVLVSGNDVYVAGVYQGTLITPPSNNNGGPGVGQYVYWKNGVPNNIDTMQLIGYPPVISVSGTDVYYTNRNGWKNGALLVFPAMGSPNKNFFTGYARCTFAVGSDVYFAGSDTSQNAVYWKNGDLNIAEPYFGRGSTVPLVSCMYVSGNDVYVGGMADRGIYWVNGTLNYMQLRIDDSYLDNLTSIFVSGNDVYNTGKIIALLLGAGNYAGAAYWKNGVEIDLQTINPPDASTTYITTSVFVTGSDVYVAGYFTKITSPAVPPTDSAVYWKNGVEYSLHTPGRANSIYVR